MAGGACNADGEAESDTEVAAEPQAATKKDAWVAAPSPVAFKDIHLRLRHLPRTDAGAGVHGDGAGRPYRPQHTSIHRSHCVVKLQRLRRQQDGSEWDVAPDLDVEASTFGFHVGQTFGYSQGGAWSVSSDPWAPPPESLRVDVPPWATEAALALEIGAAADFEVPTSESGGSQYWRVDLLEARPAYDILGDGGVVICMLDRPPAAGEKPRDLARVAASWRVWFLRSGELVASTSSDSAALRGDGGKDLVVDEGKLMVAMELGLKEMEAGSRACLRVSEQWGQGPLMPEGGPCLRGAAVWVELFLHRVENEPAAGEHESVAAALAFALGKKGQGNACLAAADFGRAVRRYEVGIRLLTTLLPGGGAGGR